MVAETGGVTQAEIGQRTRMDKVTVSRAAIALAERGLFAREAHARDRRSHHLILTDAGRELHEAIAPKALDLERRIFAGFDADDVARFTAMLRRIDAVTLALVEEG